METQAGDIEHTLPGGGGDESWLRRMLPFEREETQRQVYFKRRHWPDLESGRSVRWAKHRYPYILPIGHQEKAYFQPMAPSVPDMLRDLDIALHNESLNLKSSQAACLNFLFPLREDLGLAAAVFRRLLPGLVSVSALEFKFTGPTEATHWLGEPAGGGRGRYRTSVDAAVFWHDGAGDSRATLIEWKYTEASFGSCSAFGGGRAKKECCLALDVTAPEPARFCYVAGPGRGCGRRYWEHMRKAGIVLEPFADATGCPFRGPLYQLMRQQQLAAYLRVSGTCANAEVILVSPEANARVLEPSPELAPVSRADDTILSVWNRALSGVPPVRHISYEALAAALDAADGTDPAWRAYLRERYGV